MRETEVSERCLHGMPRRITTTTPWFTTDMNARSAFEPVARRGPSQP